MVPPAAPPIYGPRVVLQRRWGRRPGCAAAIAVAVLAPSSLTSWGVIGAARAQVEPPPPPAATSELAKRTLAAGQAMERSGMELSRQQGPQNRQRACSVFYLAQVAYARAVELGIDSAEAEIDRLEILKQSVGCGPSVGGGP
ncbi:hypothetical protein KBZ20_03935 [Vulcanococcus limneticus Candia 3F8]|uniref:hypothetical protein n=1 Tax=Vulcanococcus limneticus TaxID=2170428 RepID=UPI000B9946BA|nr:hypothetical protein [Vulcanococcus limneticus]MCP9790731.1 hypothetical protein [Vulcanococcus limneticus MW73D5]MCP9892926.1 hypothetical protein [Vulcanococcus limneticus Candia 3F8]MCP9896339.1 hypothetical protein [Vulcanococcus limneticus Candia 3B3]